MLIDMDEMMKALKKVVAEDVKRAIFEGTMLAQGREIRFIGKDEEALDLFKKNELSSEEYEFYRGRIVRASNKVEAAEREARTHKLPIEEIRDFYDRG